MNDATREKMSALAITRYKVCRPACVTIRPNKQSDVVTWVEPGMTVIADVTKDRGRRVHLIDPVLGWCNTRSRRGTTFLVPLDNTVRKQYTSRQLLIMRESPECLELLEEMDPAIMQPAWMTLDSKKNIVPGETDPVTGLPINPWDDGTIPPGPTIGGTGAIGIPLGGEEQKMPRNQATGLRKRRRIRKKPPENQTPVPEKSTSSEGNDNMEISNAESGVPQESSTLLSRLSIEDDDSHENSDGDSKGSTPQRRRYQKPTKETKLASVQDDRGYNVGDVVLVRPMKVGRIMFIGPTEFNSTGIWCGLELIGAYTGTHDGIVRGKRYFTCPKDRGYFTRMVNVVRHIKVNVEDHLLGRRCDEEAGCGEYRLPKDGRSNGPNDPWLCWKCRSVAKALQLRKEESEQRANPGKHPSHHPADGTRLQRSFIEILQNAESVTPIGEDPKVQQNSSEPKKHATKLVGELKQFIKHQNHALRDLRSQVQHIQTKISYNNSRTRDRQSGNPQNRTRNWSPKGWRGPRKRGKASMNRRRQSSHTEESFSLTLSRYVNDQSSNFCIRKVNNFTIWFDYDQVKKYYGLKRTVQQFCRLLASWEWKLQDSGFWSHNQLKFDIVPSIAEIIPPNVVRIAAEMAEHQAFSQRFAMARGRSKSPSNRSAGSSSGPAPWSWTKDNGSIPGSTEGHSSTSDQPAYRPRVMGSPHLGHVAYGGSGYGFHPSSPNVRPTFELYQPGQMQAYMMNQFDPQRRTPSQASTDATYSPRMSSYYAAQSHVHTAQTNVTPEWEAPQPRPPQQQAHHQHRQHPGHMPPSQVPTHDVPDQNPQNSAFIPGMTQASPITQPTQYQLPGPLPILFSQQPFAMGVVGVQPGIMIPSNAAGQQTARPRYSDFEPPMKPHQVVTPMMGYQPMSQPPAGPYFPQNS